MVIQRNKRSPSEINTVGPKVIVYYLPNNYEPNQCHIREKDVQIEGESLFV